MKKIVASVGIMAIGASAVQMASAQDTALVGPDQSKPWSVSATLRGFYDDNSATVPNDAAIPAGYHRDTFGIEVTPSAALVWAMQQTTLNVGLLYSLKYYENKPPGWTDHTDQTVTFNAGLTHAFNEQLRLRVSDSFVLGQEPDMLRAGNSFSTFQHVPGDNIRNYGSIGLDAQLNPTFGLSGGYDNAYYDYKAHGASLGGFQNVTTEFGPDLAQAVIPSLSGLLDRMEHRAHVEGTYQMAPETKLLLGYKFMEIDYTGNEPISGFANFVFSGLGPVVSSSNSRNSREHTVYVGAEHNFMPELTGSARVGASYTDYYNDPNTSATYTPFVDASLKYLYAPESSVQAGFSYDRNATDVVGGFNNGQFTLDAESAVFFVSVTHRIDPRLFASLMGQFQNSTLHGGFYDNTDEQYYLLGLDLEYKFNAFFSGHIGYNYDRLNSDVLQGSVKRTFDRNRVYIGVTASY